MAFSNFSKDELKKKFGVRIKENKLFNADQIKNIEPSGWLNQTLELSEHLGYETEKERSERLVSPILMELHRRNNGAFKIYSGQILNADDKLGLVGECDFLLAYGDVSAFLERPIFSVVEAKRNDISVGIVQCSAQLIGAKIFNEKEEYHSPLLFGCSTTGIEWQFLKYTDNTITWDSHRYSLSNLPQLLGVLQHIVDETGFYSDRNV